MEIKGIESGMGLSRMLPGADKGNGISPAQGAGKFFNELVSKVNELQNQSDQAIQGLASGENKNLHEVMISMEKASISFQFMSQVRNKALDAYQEIMRMTV